jgi:hypothetical protein
MVLQKGEATGKCDPNKVAKSVVAYLATSGNGCALMRRPAASVDDNVAA